MSFDGRGFALKDEQLRKALTGPGITTEVNTKAAEPYLQISKKNYQYRMMWKRQDFENGLDLRLNQIEVDKELNEIELNSQTFDGLHLRSATQCLGSTSKTMGAVGKKTVYCATATKHVCDQVLAAYKANNRLNSSGLSLAEQSKKTQSCLNTLQGMSEVVSAYAKKSDDNLGIKNARDAIIDQENKEVASMLDHVKTEQLVSYQSINSLKKQEDFGRVATELSSSFLGLRQMNSFIDLCLENKDHFSDKTSAARVEALDARKDQAQQR
jgi:hypothetical protein